MYKNELILIIFFYFVIYSMYRVPIFLKQNRYNTFVRFIIKAIISLIKMNKKQNRRKKLELIKKFNISSQDAEKIINKILWQGMKKEYLIESINQPNDSSFSILKTKIKEEYKYYPINKKSFKLVVFLENDIVVGWKMR